MFEEFKYIIIPILALGVSQILKFIIESVIIVITINGKNYKRHIALY